MDKTVADYTFEEIEEGMRFEQAYRIEEDVYEGFLSAFGDRNPIHVDDQFAKDGGFKGRVMHGAILNGFLSHFIGMKFPGKRALWLSASLHYLKPNYLGDSLLLEAEVTQKSEAGRLVGLSVSFRNTTRGEKVAKGSVQVQVRDV